MQASFRGIYNAAIVLPRISNGKGTRSLDLFSRLNIVFIDRDYPEILVSKPGLYEVCFGVFVQKQPYVQLCIDREPILATNNVCITSAAIGKGFVSKGVLSPRSTDARVPMTNIPLSKLKRVRHSRGNITGWTIVEFIALPSNTRISFTYKGPSNVQGFLSLRKL